MRELPLDIETFSPYNLKADGLFKYASKAETLWLGYCRDGETFKKHNVYKNGFPDWFISDLTDPNVIKIAHNAPFEIACLSAELNIYLDPAQWRCTMTRCAMGGLPLGLDEASIVLGLGEKKDKTGKDDIRLFCSPVKATKANGFRTRNLPEHYAARFERFGDYCIQDVKVEVAIDQNLNFIKLPPVEARMWEIDQAINNKGIRVDQTLIKNAITFDTKYRQKILTEAIQLTGLANPNSRNQLIKWLEEETDDEILNLQKKTIPKLIEKYDSKIVKRVLQLKEELSKTSVKKYTAMLRALLDDGRIKGLFQYCGAGRTWRFAGRLVQLQNLVKGKYHYHKDIDFDDLDFARTLLLNGEYEMLLLCYGAIPNTLSNLIRTAIIPAKGKRFIVSDFSAIEARILAWLAGEKWRLDIFNSHGKIYEASAAKILKKPLEKVTKDERAKYGKIPELAYGYAGGLGAAVKFGALDLGLTEDEITKQVKAWRVESPKIVQLWYDVDRAAKKAIHSGEKVHIQKGITFMYRRKCLIIGLPSGHSLYYYNASLVPGPKGVQIQYYGMDQTTKKWCKIRTYGGKLVENICQAIGRDCLVNALVNLDEAGYSTVIHVHDEVVTEELIGEGSLKEVNRLMCKKAAWMGDLPLTAEGFETNYYKKD